MSKIYLITQNNKKLEAAIKVFDRYGIEIVPFSEDFKEIQADTSLEIARDAAVKLAKKLNEPVIREDHSLFVHALGIPGPYTHYIEKMMPAQKLFQLLSYFEDRTGHFEAAVVYAEPDGKTFEYVFSVPVDFSKEIKGDSPAWDNILMMKGDPRTFSEYSYEERAGFWTEGFDEVARHLSRMSKPSRF